MADLEVEHFTPSIGPRFCFCRYLDILSKEFTVDKQPRGGGMALHHWLARSHEKQHISPEATLILQATDGLPCTLAVHLRFDSVCRHHAAAACSSK
eukprot:1137071-Pelagomonas_calceolata.AAC.2